MIFFQFIKRKEKEYLSIVHCNNNYSDKRGIKHIILRLFLYIVSVSDFIFISTYVRTNRVTEQKEQNLCIFCNVQY